MSNDDWKLRAACRGKTDLFFAPHRERPAKKVIREAQALLICASCPVTEECDAAAQEQQGEFGIWAGKTEDYYAKGF